MEEAHFTFGGPLKGAPVVTLAAGNLEAEFLPSHGMLCTSLREGKTEILRRVDDLETAASKGSTAAIPLLHPWANRLSGRRYRAAGVTVPLEGLDLPVDTNGLPIHGLLAGAAGWRVERHEAVGNGARLAASFDFGAHDELMAAFPFPHELLL